MREKTVTERDRNLARGCLQCPLCRYARRKQKGTVYWLVKAVESRLCPYCKAYERVYGRKAHEPIPHDE